MTQNVRYSGQAEAYTLDYFDQYESTIRNGEARLPICFCIDVSASMSNLTNPNEDLIYTGKTQYKDGQTVNIVELKPGVIKKRRDDEVQRVLRNMIYKIKENKIISKAAVVSVITFDQFADCMLEFTDVMRISPSIANDIHAADADYTNVGKGLEMAMDRLERFQKMNGAAGNESYKPVLIFMSDGEPTDENEAKYWQDIVRKQSENGKLNVISIGIGSINSFLKGMSKDRDVYQMHQDYEFDKVFSIISKRIELTTAVISVDEEISDIEDTSSNIESTKYGISSSDQEMLDFMKSFLE